MYHVGYFDQDGDLCVTTASSIYIAEAPKNEAQKMQLNGNKTTKTIYFHCVETGDEYFTNYHLDLFSKNIDKNGLNKLITEAFETGKLDLTPYGKCVPN